MTKSWRDPNASPGVKAARTVEEKLTDLHRILLTETLADEEVIEQRKLSPLEALHAATTSTAFAWLRPLSELIVEIGSSLAAFDPQPEDLAAIAMEVEALVMKSPRSERPDSTAARVRARVDVSVVAAAAFAGLEQALAVFKQTQTTSSGASEGANEPHRRAERRTGDTQAKN